MWDDFAAAQRLVRGRPCVVVATNDAGADPRSGRIDHWVTMHTDKLAAWKLQRWRHGGSGDYVTWSRPETPEGVDRLLPQRGVGSIGLLATWVALQVAERAILCGVPMDLSPHFLPDSPRDNWNAYAMEFREAWVRYADELRPRVRSLSGWTGELLGTPDVAWLDGAESAKLAA